MREKGALFILLGISDQERHGLARGVQLRLGNTIGIAQNDVRRLAIDHLLFRCKFIRVGLTGRGIELVSHGPRRMIHPVAKSHYGKDHQRGDLDHVDGDVDRRRTVYSAVRDIGDAKGERHGDCHHEHRPGVGRAHKAGPKSSSQKAAENPHDANHHAGINPVIQVRAPAHDKLRQAGVGPRLFVVEERLLGEIV